MMRPDGDRDLDDEPTPRQIEAKRAEEATHAENQRIAQARADRDKREAAGAAQRGALQLEDAPDPLMPALAEQLGAAPEALAAMRAQAQRTASAEYRRLKATMWPLADTADTLAAALAHYEARRPPANRHRQHERLLRELRQELVDLQARLRGKPVPIERLPAGEYTARIVESSLDKGSIWLIREITGGARDGCLVEQVLCIRSRNAARDRAGQKALRELCEAIGLQGLEDTVQLHGKPHVLAVDAGGISCRPHQAPDSVVA